MGGVKDIWKKSKDRVGT